MSVIAQSSSLYCACLAVAVVVTVLEASERAIGAALLAPQYSIRFCLTNRLCKGRSYTATATSCLL